MVTFVEPPLAPCPTYIVAGMKVLKVFYRCFFFMLGENSTHTWGLDWFSLYPPYLRGKGGANLPSNCSNCMSCLPYNPNE